MPGKKKTMDIRDRMPDRIMARDYLYNYLLNYIGHMGSCSDMERETMRCLFTATCLIGNSGAGSNACSEILDTMYMLLGQWGVDYKEFCEYMTAYL